MENVASRFGQRLAHTEKKYRDQALKKLSAYLTKRTEWSALEWDKLWKALFYCMWMSDKRAVQDELSTNLARLVHAIPSVDDALGFCHSFFRTMHREWHGIDGLRLDKFYALIRKFVHETLLLLRNHDWERALVERVVSILSSEIMSQLPNGLRLHTTDLFLTELHGAAGDSVDTETFLLLLEPFFTLLSSEYDKTVFKRVRELVFLPMLSTYKFGPQSPAKKKKKTKKTESEENDTDKEEDEEEEEEEPKVFDEVELPFVQHRIFSIASADDTAERNRSVLYELYSHFFKVTKIDSLKATQDGTPMPKKKAVTKKRKQPDAEILPVDDGEKKKKKNKKRKKTKQSDDAAMANAEAEPEADEPDAEAEELESQAVTPEKRSKKYAETSKTPVNTPVKNAEVVVETPTKKSKKNAKAVVDDVIMEAAKTLDASTVESVKKAKKDKKKRVGEVKVVEEIEVVEVEVSKKNKKKVKADDVEALKKQVEDEVAAALEQVAVSKKLKKKDKKKAEVDADVDADAEAAKATLSKKDKKPKKEVIPPKPKETKAETVIRSGMKFRRCGGCGGIGKGLVPVGKDCCRHCDRTGQLKKKAMVADKKKRKADVLAAAAAAAASVDDEVVSKKVTFGKNRALAHELSVKRLKASKTVVKELTSDIKGVLKAGASPSATILTKTKTKSKKRMTAADFF